MELKFKKLTVDELNRPSKDTFHAETKTTIVIVLDNVRSHHNVGSVFRTADGFAIEKIFLCGITPVPPHREIEKTALGSTETIPFEFNENTQHVVQQLKTLNYKIIAVEQTENSTPLHKLAINKNDKVVLIFGHEVFGIQQDVLELCDAVIEIPQLGTKHSLNISVCMGMVTWEVVKQIVFTVD